MKKSITILTIFIASVLFTTAADQTRPNILWIFADDLGVEVGCYGNKDVATPHIDQLASEGVMYTKAYATAPVCSASRSAIATGRYQVSINSQNHRTVEMRELPDGILPITEYFRKAGYFCTNASGKGWDKNGKTDFNFLAKNVFDGNDWRERAEGQPFFAQLQIQPPHRSFHHDHERPIDPETVNLPDCYIEHPLLKADWAMYLETIQQCDRIVGAALKRLEEDGLADNTIVFFFGDNGRPHLRDKQFLYEGGLIVPLIVRYPEKLKAGKIDQQLVSLIDVTATSLDLAGIEVPEHMHGNIFLGKNKKKREYVYGFRQRAGDAVDDMCSVTDGRYKLIWNRLPNKPWMQVSNYKKGEYPAFALYHYLYNRGDLPAPHDQFMAKTRPDFELFDLKKDPMEFNNLYGLKKLKKIQQELEGNLVANMKEWEENLIPESEESTQKAIAGSNKYFKKMMKNKGLPEDPTYEELLEYWNNYLLVE